MSGQGYRTLLECRRRSEALRDKGFTYDQIADVLAIDHNVSPLRLYRYAHGLTAAAAVAEYNALDPAGAASLREPRLYEYESGARRPPAHSLARFARIYHTTARRLAAHQYPPRDQEIIDVGDYQHLDSQRCHATETAATVKEGSSTDLGGPSVRGCAELLCAVDSLEANMKRREMLFELALALGGTAALPLLRHLTPDEEVRLAQAVRGGGRIDAQTVAAIEKLTARCRRLDDTYGPTKVISVVDKQRDLVDTLMRRDSLLPGLRDRMIAAYAQLSQLSGYLYFNLTEHAAAADRFGDALDASLEVGDTTLAAYVHQWLCQMACYRGKPAKALDHAFAAQGWARKSPSHLLRSQVQLTESWALALSDQPTRSLQQVETAQEWARRPTSADPPYLYWIKESQELDSFACLTSNALKRPESTIPTLTTHLDGLGDAYVGDRAFGLVRLSEAYTMKKEIPAAAAKLSEAASLMSTYNSACLVDEFRTARAHLEPWADNSHVRELDERIRTPAAP